MFQLAEEEVEAMVSQNAIPSKQSLGGYLPVVFTEQGMAKELVSDSVVKESLTTATDGKNYNTKFYNLDVIISV